MAALSDYSENLLLQWLMTTAVVTRPTAWHVALFSVAPSDAGGGTELSGGGYARQPAAFTVSGNVASNSAVIEFVNNGALDWPNIVAVGIFDAATLGNLLFHGLLASARDPALNDTIRFAAGTLTATLN